MSNISFDTHAFVKRLTAAGMSEEQAETITAVLRESREADLDQLATEADLVAFEARVATKADLAALEARIVKWLVPLLLGQAAVIVALVKLL